MKKKILSCALACALILPCASTGLAACGGDENTAKYHSAEQWTAAFSDAGTRECFTFTETKPSEKTDLDYDENIDYYSIMVATTDANNYTTHKGDLIFKDGNYYYNRTDLPDGDGVITYEISSDDATEAINNPLKSTAEKLLDLCKTGYDKFSAASTHSGEVEAHIYKATNVDLKVDASNTVVLEDLYVYINDANASLYRVSANFKTDNKSCQYNYWNRDSFAAGKEEYCQAPDRIEGNTFKLAAITPSDPDYEKWTDAVVEANKGKTVTGKADGEIEGNIEIDMTGDGSAILRVNTMKYTENFKQSGTYGAVSVSNAHLAIADDMKVTLTGDLAHGFSSTEFGDALVLRMTQGGVDYTCYFAVVQ